MDVHIIYSYDLAKLDSSKKVRFVYVIKGRRGEEGIVAKNDGRFITKSCFYVLKKHEEKFDELFSFWKIKPNKLEVNLITKIK